MDIRGAAAVGIQNDFVDQLDHGAVFFAEPISFLNLFGLLLQLRQNIIDLSHLLFVLGKQFNKIEHILLEGHIEFEPPPGEQGLNLIDALKIMRIVNANHDRVTVRPQGNPDVVAHKGYLQSGQQLPGNGVALVEGDERAL